MIDVNELCQMQRLFLSAEILKYIYELEENEKAEQLFKVHNILELSLETFFESTKEYYYDDYWGGPISNAILNYIHKNCEEKKIRTLSLCEMIEGVNYSLNDFYDEVEDHYSIVFPGYKACNIIESILNKSEKSHQITWNFIDKGMLCENNTVIRTLEAEHIDLETWKIMCLYKEEAESGNDGNYTYNFVYEPELSKLELPYCNSGPFVSSEETIKGNMIDVNSDVIGTDMGALAERIYIYYIPEEEKYAIVEVKYPCL
ncbi:MAG: hypothetical protein N4A40_13145 [Tissierellales bacterium]|jgi:hypothetical protein|nr:hypothetical protein [Tissierellales bacterium]